MSSEPAAGQRKRLDAQRNRSHILEVAEQAFTEAGLDVSMDSIAKRAGVGAGTLYRHFPNRDALIAAVLHDRSPDLRREAEAIKHAEADSLTALERWLSTLSEWMRAYDGLSEPLRAAQAQQTSLTPTCQEVIASTQEFLGAAQRDGQARAGVTGRDLYLATLATVWAAGTAITNDPVEDGLRDLLRTGWFIDKNAF